MTKLFTLEDVLPIAQRLVQLDRVNPVEIDPYGNPTCVYSNGKGSYCIAGEICKELGALPDDIHLNLSENTRGFDSSRMESKFDALSADLICYLQEQADKVNEAGNLGTNWRNVRIPSMFIQRGQGNE